jgi:flagellar FliL protein
VAATDTVVPVRSSPSLIVQIAVLLTLTGFAAVAGWVTGQFLTAQGSAAVQGIDVVDGIKPDTNAGTQTGNQPSGEGSIVPLEPILTNLAGPGDAWVRAELTLRFDGKPDSEIAELIHQDILAYLRTVKLQQVEGASGFQHLRSDLEERAQVRSGGKVKSILIRTLLFE